jgi:hypothetical protein
MGEDGVDDLGREGAILEASDHAPVSDELVQLHGGDATGRECRLRG